MAAPLQVSPDTVRKRIHKFGLQGLAGYPHMKDVELDTITKEYVETHPNCGSRSYAGYLRSRSLKVRRYHVRESAFRVDSEAVCGRFRQALHRTRYSVSMPNGLWHIDFGYLLSSSRFLNKREYIQWMLQRLRGAHLHTCNKASLHYPGYLLSRILRHLEFLSQHALGSLLHLLTRFAASMGYGFMLHGPQDCTIAWNQRVYIFNIQYSIFNTWVHHVQGAH